MIRDGRRAKDNNVVLSYCLVLLMQTKVHEVYARVNLLLACKANSRATQISKAKKQSLQLPLSGHADPVKHWHYSSAKSQCWQIHLGRASIPQVGLYHTRVMMWAPKSHMDHTH